MTAQLESLGMKSSLLALTLLLAPAVFMPALVATPTYAAATITELGDLASFHTIVQDALDLANKGDLSGAAKRITDYETAWDTAQSTLQAKSRAKWRMIDQASDDAITALRAKSPNANTIKTALAALIAALDQPQG